MRCDIASLNFSKQAGITLASVNVCKPLQRSTRALALRQKVIAVAGTESVEFDLKR